MGTFNRLHFIRQLIEGIENSDTVALVDVIIRPFLSSNSIWKGPLDHPFTENVWIPSCDWMRVFSNNGWGFSASGYLLSKGPNYDELRILMGGYKYLFVDFFDEMGWIFQGSTMQHWSYPYYSRYHFAAPSPLMIVDMQFNIVPRYATHRSLDRILSRQIALATARRLFPPPIPTMKDYIQSSPVSSKRNYSPHRTLHLHSRKPPKKGRRGKMF
jgi:hypothetical protein